MSGDDEDRAVAAARSLVEAIPAPALACEPETRAIRAVNDRAASLFGRDRSMLTLMGLDDLGQSDRTVDGTPIEHAFGDVDGVGGSADRAAFEWDVPIDEHRHRLAIRTHTTTLADRSWLIVVAIDVTDQARATERLRSQSRTVDALAATAPAAVFRCDAGGTLVQWNDRLATDTGYDGTELSGKALPDLFDDVDRSVVSDALAAVYREGGITSREVTLLMRSGETVPYRLTIGPTRDEDGSVTGVVGFGEDLTAETLREERLAVLTRVLRHNFRNDLNVIAGFSRRARHAVDDPETVEQLDRVIDTAGRLLHLGETARKVERLLADRPVPMTVSLAAAVSDAIDSLPAALRERGDVDVDVPADLTVSAVDRFSDAIAELVDNAIRHNDAERPRVHVTAAELPSESWVSLVIADDGPGLPSAERAVLTGEESSLDHASGLGLWYVNWVVTAGGGSCDIAESKAGGTRIELSLRTAPDE